MQSSRQDQDALLIGAFVKNKENTMEMAISNSVGMVILQLHKEYFGNATPEEIAQKHVECFKELEEMGKEDPEFALLVDFLKNKVEEKPSDLDLVTLYFPEEIKPDGQKIESKEIRYLFPLKDVLTLVFLAIHDDKKFKLDTASVQIAKNKKHRLESFKRCIRQMKEQPVCHHGNRNDLVFLLNKIYDGVDLILDPNITIYHFLKDEVHRLFREAYENDRSWSDQRSDLRQALFIWMSTSDPTQFLKQIGAEKKLRTALHDFFKQHGILPEKIKLDERITHALSCMDFSASEVPSHPELAMLANILSAVETGRPISRSAALVTMQTWIRENCTLAAKEESKLVLFCHLYEAHKTICRYQVILDLTGRMTPNIQALLAHCLTFFDSINTNASEFIPSPLLPSLIDELNSAVKSAISEPAIEQIELFFVRWFDRESIDPQQERKRLYLGLLDDTFRAKIFLTDDEITKLATPDETKSEIPCSVYEINRVFLHAILKAPAEWTPQFAAHFAKVLEFVKRDFDGSAATRFIASSLRNGSYPDDLIQQLNYLNRTRQNSDRSAADEEKEWESLVVPPRYMIIMPEHVKTMIEWEHIVYRINDPIQRDKLFLRCGARIKKILDKINESLSREPFSLETISKVHYLPDFFSLLPAGGLPDFTFSRLDLLRKPEPYTSQAQNFDSFVSQHVKIPVEKQNLPYLLKLLKAGLPIAKHLLKLFPQITMECADFKVLHEILWLLRDRDGREILLLIGGDKFFEIVKNGNELLNIIYEIFAHFDSSAAEKFLLSLSGGLIRFITEKIEKPQDQIAFFFTILRTAHWEAAKKLYSLLSDQIFILVKHEGDLAALIMGWSSSWMKDDAKKFLLLLASKPFSFKVDVLKIAPVVFKQFDEQTAEKFLCSLGDNLVINCKNADDLANIIAAILKCKYDSFETTFESLFATQFKLYIQNVYQLINFFEKIKKHALFFQDKAESLFFYLLRSLGDNPRVEKNQLIELLRLCPNKESQKKLLSIVDNQLEGLFAQHIFNSINEVWNSYKEMYQRRHPYFNKKNIKMIDDFVSSLAEEKKLTFQEKSQIALGFFFERRDQALVEFKVWNGDFSALLDTVIVDCGAPDRCKLLQPMWSFYDPAPLWSLEKYTAWKEKFFNRGVCKQACQAYQKRSRSEEASSTSCLSVASKVAGTKVPLILSEQYSRWRPSPFSEDDQSLLRALGFALNKKERVGAYEYFVLPPYLQCKERHHSFNNKTYTIYWDDIPVISINQKMDSRDPQVRFFISQENIEIKKNQYAARADVLTPFQYSAVYNLDQLKKDVEMRINCQKGIEDSLRVLQSYMDENPYEFRQVIASKKEYQQLFVLFPEWIDVFSIDLRKPLALSNEEHNLSFWVNNIGRQKALSQLQKGSSQPAIENDDPHITQLKKLCYEYANEIYPATSGYKGGSKKKIANEKIGALKTLREVLDQSHSIQPDKGKIVATVNSIKNTLMQDGDFLAIKFLKEFGRILKAVFTGNLRSNWRVSKNENGTVKFWKSASELRAAKFLKEVRESMSEENAASRRVLF